MLPLFIVHFVKFFLHLHHAVSQDHAAFEVKFRSGLLDLLRDLGDLFFVGSHGDNVVSVMRDGGSHGAAFQPVAPDIADADMMRIIMPLSDDDLQDVLLHVDPVGVAGVRRDNLARHHAEHAARARFGEVRRRQVQERGCGRPRPPAARG